MDDNVYFALIEPLFAETLAELQQNDRPAEQSIMFSLFKRRSGNAPNSINYDEALSQALERNNTLRKIILVISPRLTFLDQWSSVLRVIGSGQGGNGIRTVCLAYPPNIFNRLAHPLPGEDEDQRTETIARSIFQQIQSIPTLINVDLMVPVLPVTVLSSFLDNAPPLFHGLTLEKFSLQKSEDMNAFAAALERRNRIKPVFFQLPGFSVSTVELLSKLLKRDIPLNTVESAFTFVMDEGDMGDAALRRRILPLLLTFLSKLNIMVTHFLEIQSEEVFNEISTNIPINLRGFKIEVQGTNDWASVADSKRSFMAALKRNIRLMSVEAEFSDGADFFNGAETRKVEFYANRNKRFFEWAKNPNTLPPNLWPIALQLAAEAGHSELYARLLSVSSDLGTNKRKRKRKRPNRYVP